MATVRLRFGGDTGGVIFHAILERAPESPVGVNTALPVKLEGIINKALEKDRELRYQHAADMRADLKRLKRDTESGHALTVDARTRPARRKIVAGLAAGAVIVTAAIGAFLHYRSRQGSESPPTPAPEVPSVRTPALFPSHH